MHIVQLGPLPPPFGGVSTNLTAIHDLLQGRGHTSSIIAITNSGIGDGEENIYRPRSAFQLLKLLFTLDFDVVHLHRRGIQVRLAVLTFSGNAAGKRSGFTFTRRLRTDAVKFAKPRRCVDRLVAIIYRVNA